MRYFKLSLFKNAYEIVLGIPKLANDRMHLKSFENHQSIAVGDFVIQDTFSVSEPKRYFKRERELHVFLFESNIVFAKKEELNSKKMGYAYKDSMLVQFYFVLFYTCESLISCVKYTW